MISSFCLVSLKVGLFIRSSHYRNSIQFFEFTTAKTFVSVFWYIEETVCQLRFLMICYSLSNVLYTSHKENCVYEKGVCE
jgi:hypothetical protein